MWTSRVERTYGRRGHGMAFLQKEEEEAPEIIDLTESPRRKEKRRRIDTEIIEGFLLEPLTTPVPYEWDELELEILEFFLQ